MATVDDDVIDSQIIVENISFLNDCFDNSFALQSSLITIREYVSQGHKELHAKEYSSLKKLNTTVFNNSVLRDSHNPIKTFLHNNENFSSKRICDWGLPQEIASKYAECGITEMFDWQVKCLGNSKILQESCNLVYSAPTSAGKTLVAEILAIKTVLEQQKKVLIILPFVSIVREKMFYLQGLLSSSGIRVEGFMGSQSPPGGLQSVHVAICTIEKANSLINRLLDENCISELGTVVVDELHLLGDPHRGYILELLLTKIKYVSEKRDDVQIQIVGMSATLPNLDALANWLRAELFITEFRPIPLDEYCLVGNKYYDRHGKAICNINGEKLTNLDNDNVLSICLETIKSGCSILIFCMTKNRCENLAQTIASSFFNLGCSGNDMGVVLRQQLKSENIAEVLEQLKNCPVGLDQVLKNVISFGVSYHHAGLTFDERDIIEGGFKSGAIRVLVATSTLSSGVNLPAKKVIIRTPMFQRKPINILTYKQMIGRAGRMGKDTSGESILICTESEKKLGFDLMMGILEPVRSCIDSEDKFMRAVLEIIASQMACTKEELDLYSKCTLLYNQKNELPSHYSLLENTLEELKNFELIRIQSDGEQKRYVATSLGKACLSSSMAPHDGLSLFCELQKARQCLVLETDLHLIYLVTPYSVSSQWGEIDWLHLLTLWESLTMAMKRVGDLVGVQESFIIRCLRGTSKLNNVQNRMNIHKRFYTALALQDLVNEVSLSEVAIKFQCSRGFLQSLQQAAATFAGMVTSFCHQLGWKNMEMVISQFQDRLHFGIHSELLELMKLPSLNGKRARTLFDHGFECISSIASSEPIDIENALLKSIPFQSERERDNDDIDDIKKRNKLKSIWITGFCGMTTKEAAEKLILEARKHIELEIGVTDIKWSKISADYSSGKTNNTRINVEASTSSHPITIQDTKQSVDIGQILHNKTESITLNDVGVTTSVNKDVVTSEILCSFNNESKIDNSQISNRIKPTLCSSPLVEYNVPVSGREKKSQIYKDDILWDSLNFTEIVNGNISKVQNSDNTFSPNISFGEDKEESFSGNDLILKNKLPKDITLFSSDGDNSSLFEESLPVDLISSKFVCDKDENNVEYSNSTVLNGFTTTMLENEDDDMKLIYEDENRNELNELETNLSVSDDIELNNSSEIINTQVKIPLKHLTGVTSRQKDWQPLAKKMKRDSKIIESYIPKLTSKISSSFKLKIAAMNLTCFVLKENDIIDNWHIIENIQNVALYMTIKNNAPISDEQIGDNILKQTTVFTNYNKGLKNTTTHVIDGIALYFGVDVCIYLDLSSLNDLMRFLHKLKLWLKQKSVKMKLMSVKSCSVHFKQEFGIVMPTNCFDVSLVEWLVDNDEKIPNIGYLVKKYCHIELLPITFIQINDNGKTMKCLDPVEDVCLKSRLVWEVATNQEKQLLDKYQDISKTIGTEIHVSKILGECEYYGLTVDRELASQLLIDVRSSQEILQKKAYRICGYHFNFNSTKAVAKALGMYRGRKVSTKKSMLSAHNTPISSIVIYWRKLNSILTKTLYPLTEKASIYSKGNRINPSYTLYTCTGRISMHEPNLQNVPRTFSIPIEYLTANEKIEDCSNDVVEFNCRNVFKASPDHVLVSADYCQLEMRILTHYSEDKVLMTIMKSGMDVFKSIAASWGGVPEEQVDDDLRQKAKQLCYGILYGMGNKTLGQYLDVSEMEAAVFMDSFYKTYPAIKTFTQLVVQKCRENGYVETLMKRRRYLPDVNSNIVVKKSAAERQAVNTTIQGSAADIAKAAMCAIDIRTEGKTKPQLILQMHDELIYEVPESYQQTFISVIKEVMESTVRLRVPLPVKVKSGYTWGSLKEVEL